MFIDQYGNILSEKPVYKPSKLFKDCFEETYLITDNNASKLEIKPKEIQYKEDVPIKEFNQTYGAFDFAINNKVYFSTYHYQYFVIYLKCSYLALISFIDIAASLSTLKPSTANEASILP